jgi:hypothetical protein
MAAITKSKSETSVKSLDCRASSQSQLRLNAQPQLPQFIVLVVARRLVHSATTNTHTVAQTQKVFGKSGGNGYSQPAVL